MDSLYNAKSPIDMEAFLVSLGGDIPTTGLGNKEPNLLTAADHALLAQLDEIIAPTDSGHALTSTIPRTPDDDDTEEEDNV